MEIIGITNRLLCENNFFEQIELICKENFYGLILREKDLDDETLKALAFEQDGVKRNIEGKEIKKVIVVKNKIVNIVAI